MFCHQCGTQLSGESKFCHKCGSSHEQSHQGSEVLYVTSPKNRKKGMFFLVLPPVGLVAILSVYAVVSFILTSLGVGAESELITSVASIINVVLSLFGIICVVGIFIGVPVGIIYLKKKEPVDGAVFDERSGKGSESVVPREICGWNWGAAGLGIIWGLYHSVWISLLNFIPVVNYFWWIVIGIKGNEWAWRKNKWESVDQFKRSQRKWKPWGIAIFVLVALSLISIFFSSIQEGYNNSQQETINATPQSQEQQNVAPDDIVGQADYNEGWKAGYADGRVKQGQLGDNFLPPATLERRPFYAEGYLGGFLKGCREGNFDCSEIEQALQDTESGDIITL